MDSRKFQLQKSEPFDYAKAKKLSGSITFAILNTPNHFLTDLCKLTHTCNAYYQRLTVANCFEMSFCNVSKFDIWQLHR